MSSNSAVYESTTQKQLYLLLLAAAEDFELLCVFQLVDTESDLQEMERWLQSNPVSISIH